MAFSTAPAICHVCGAPKDLALGRCGACGVVPIGSERELAVLCSTAVLDAAALDVAQRRLRSGERLQPTEALRERAAAALRGAPPSRRPLTGRELGLLVAANLLVTPLIGYAAWFRIRTDGGPAGRQILAATFGTSAFLLVAWAGWRFYGVWKLAE